MPPPQALDPSLLFNWKVWSGEESKTYYSRLTWHVYKGQSVWIMENLALIFPQHEKVWIKNPMPCCKDYLKFPSHSRQWQSFIFLISHLLCNSLQGFKQWEWAGNGNLSFTAFAQAHAGYFTRWFLCRRNNELYESNIFTAVENYSLAMKGSGKTLKTM